MDLDQIEALSLPNYTAISMLEHLGVKDPSQEQINRAEAAVTIMTHPRQVTLKTIRQCVGNDKLAVLFLYLRNKEQWA